MPKFYMALALLCCPLVCSAQTATTQTTASRQPTKPPARPTPKPAESFVWTEEFGKNSGISHDDFVSMGLGKLAQNELGSLVNWSFVQRQNAMQAMREATVTYTCGRTSKDEAANPKVRVIVEAATNSPSEVTSGFNQKLRSMPDIEIVYTADDADVLVSLVAFENKSVNGVTVLGYSATIATAIPCKTLFGEQSLGQFSKMTNHFLFAGPQNPEAMIRDMVSSVDTDALDNARKERFPTRRKYKYTKTRTGRRHQRGGDLIKPRG
jgi:hypothetical protein